MSVNIFKNNALTKIAKGLKDSAVTITNNLLATKSGTALDAVQGKVLDDKITKLNSSLVSNIYVGSDGKLHKVQGGADTVLPFSSSSDLIQIYISFGGNPTPTCYIAIGLNGSKVKELSNSFSMWTTQSFNLEYSAYPIKVVGSYTYGDGGGAYYGYLSFNIYVKDELIDTFTYNRPIGFSKQQIFTYNYGDKITKGFLFL